MTTENKLYTAVSLKTIKICKAKSLSQNKRKEIALKSISGTRKITDLAEEEEVSRKFIYHQQEIAKSAIDNAFSDKKENEEEVLFYIPVTKSWLMQVILGLSLLCRGSYRGIIEFCFDILGYKISLGGVHNIVNQAIEKAIEINNSEDLSKIRVASNDELFQQGMPVLAGVDLDSTYCYLLVNEEHRDADTWGIHLLYAMDKGFNPEYTVADFGKGLRAGQKLALPNVPCFGDVFHPLYDFKRVLRVLENIAYSSIINCEKLEKANKKSKNNSLSDELKKAKLFEASNIQLYEDLRVLIDWLQKDILSLIGYDFQTRSKLYDFITEELKKLKSKRITRLYRMLVNQKENLLMFVQKLESYLNEIAQQYNVPFSVIQDMFKLQALNKTKPEYFKLESKLRDKFGLQFLEIQEQVKIAIKKIYRASSPVENLNGRLRSYFSLRQQIGAQYLDLLRFFLNHHKFVRSHHADRVGKSPAELMTGNKHPHWLELLGFTPFKQFQKF